MICPNCNESVDITPLRGAANGERMESVCACGAELVTVVYLDHITDLRKRASRVDLVAMDRLDVRHLIPLDANDSRTGGGANG